MPYGVAAVPYYIQGTEKYMHGVHANRGRAMCNIQNRTIPVVLHALLQKLPTKKI
jgi:hypothetical protein